MSSLIFLETFTSPFILFMDYWVLVVTVLVLAYLIGRFPNFEKKEVAVTYILFMSLFVFWSLRNLASQVFDGRVPFYVDAFSLVLDFAVLAFSAHLFLRYWRERDVKDILKQFDLHAEVEEEPGHSHMADGVEVEYDDMEAGYSYLILEQGTDYGFELFRNAVTKTPGLCFSRKYPDKIRRRHELEETPVVWFTERDDVEEHKTVEPFRLNYVEETIMTFIEENKDQEGGAVILMDGVEYLLFKNPFEKFITFIENLMDKISDQPQVTLLLTLEAESLDDKKLALLREEFDEVRSMDKEGNIEKEYY